MKILHIIAATALMMLTATQAKAADILTVRDTITDPAIVYPESYEADVHKMNSNWYMQNYIQLDRPAENSIGTEVSDQELIDRLQRLPVVIEMPFNSVVRSYIDMYTQRRRSLVETMLGMSTYYMPIFEAALDAEGMPLELKYLPIIESALNPDAVSRAGATGLWQFMLPTARGLGMEISSLVDERRDPIVSSRMAARYLHQLYDIYNDWSLAIAAYNCGPGNVNKALRQAGEGKKDFWEIYPYLPQETRGYVPAFIAANYVMHYYPEHNISPALARRPILTDTVTVGRRIHFRQISEVLEIPIEELRTLNPQYREDVVPGHIRPYRLILPSHQSLAYVISEDSIAGHEAYRYNPRAVVEPSTGATTVSDDGQYIITEKIQYHKVKKGETFSSIARRYGVTVASIKKANGISTLKRGRTIKIVTTVRTPRPAQEQQPDAPEEITAPSDTLIVAGDSVAAFIDQQPAPADAPQGDITEQAETEEISEPAPTPQPEPKAADKPAKKDTTTYHKVRSGENLYKIAKRYGTTVDKITRLNPSINPSKLSVGQKIRVK